MELSNKLSNIIEIENKSIEKSQNSFLESNLWKVINLGLNTGIRALLPDLIENQVIKIKDAIINSGFKEGARQAINSAVDLGKSTMGIVTGKFENISQAQNAIKNGGIIDSVSNILNYAIDKSEKKKLISKSIADTIKRGKNVILNTIESNIESNFNNQLSSLDKLNKHSKNWKIYYNQHNFEGMEKEYKRIKENLKNILPIENTIKQVREIENLHLLIKNNGQNFNLSQEQISLAQRLTT